MSAKINGHLIISRFKDYAVVFPDDDEIVECGDEEDAQELLHVVNVILDGDAKVKVRHVYMSDWEDVE